METPTESLEVVPAPQEQQDALSGVSPAQLRQSMQLEIKKRAIVKEFIGSQLVEGVDFGVIEAVSKSGRNFKSKPTLLKPGQEKIFSLFQIVAELVRDDETLGMFDEATRKNLIAYKCNLYKAGKKIAEGRGAAKYGEKGRDENSTIKIAEKRARMDACLTLGFSEYFTQDLEDSEYRPESATSRQAASQTVEGTTPLPSVVAGILAVTDKEIKQSQGGTTYAVIAGNFRRHYHEGSTDWVAMAGIKAWKNTQAELTVGGAYAVLMDVSDYRGEPSYAIAKVERVIKAPEAATIDPEAPVDLAKLDI